VAVAEERSLVGLPGKKNCPGLIPLLFCCIHNTPINVRLTPSSISQPWVGIYLGGKKYGSILPPCCPADSCRLSLCLCVWLFEFCQTNLMVVSNDRESIKAINCAGWVFLVINNTRPVSDKVS